MNKLVKIITKKSAQSYDWATVLHNYFLKNIKGSYCPPQFADYYDGNGHLVEGRQFRASERAKQVQEIFKEFINSTEGSLD